MIKIRKVTIVIALSFAFASASSGDTGSVGYSYDIDGRIVTARYSNGICVVYTYDENGNRTSQTNSTGITIAQWGTGSWGCFNWTAP